MSSRNRDDSTNSSRAQIGIEAAEWLVSLQEAEPEEAYAEALARQAAWLDWLHRSPKHLPLFLETLETERRLHNIDPQRLTGIRQSDGARTADVITLYGNAKQASAERTRGADITGTPASGQSVRRFTRNAAVGLAAMALILIFAAILSLNLLGPFTFATGIGEQRICKLEDGSVV